MMVSYPEDIKNFKQFPLTLCLLVVNFLIYLLIFDGAESHPKPHPLLQTKNLIITARMYLQAIGKFETEHLKQVPDWAWQVHRGNKEQMEILGSYSLRDEYFLKYSGEASFQGDQIQIADWRQMIRDFQNYVKKQPVYHFGLSKQNSVWGWLTYQFSHLGFLHLLSNMIFLVFTGFAVEGLLGGVGLLILYLCGGFAGGMLFLWFNKNGSLPMIGASASISALIAFYCIAETKWRVRYLYFLSPVQGHFGSIYLSPLLILPLYVLVDFTYLFTAPEGLNTGVAYSAHVGGSLIGLLFALMYRLKVPAL